MPATEEPYRNQRPLHVVFALSSLALVATTVWMILDDHMRPWKQVQRDFQQVERAKLVAQREQAERSLLEEHQGALDEADARIAEAERRIAGNTVAIAEQRRKIANLQGEYSEIDTRQKFLKAELDSQRSLYDGMVERGENRRAYEYLTGTIQRSQRQLDELTREFQAAEARLGEAREHLNLELRGNIDELIRERDAQRREVERLDRTLQQKEAEHFGPLAWFRDLPLIDVAAPPTKIQQIWLPDLTINYNFKEVPRYDRCTTCHLGIDRLGYDEDADGMPMPQPFASHPWLTEGATGVDPRGNVIEAGLYLDPSGPHPINDFGCTVCHGGQGSGTDFSYASHTPNDLEEKHRWEHEHGWFEVHHWDYPMLPNRFVESSCLKCHHQVTDVPQAEKLQAGYNRIVKYGCTGCHTIGGEGAIGPDLTDSPKVGPNLAHVAYKVSDDWLAGWIKNPHAFRPDTRMPRFYDLENNAAPRDGPLADAEIHAMVHYLNHGSVSTPPPGFVPPAEAGQAGANAPPARPDTDAARGRELFLQKGCLACHAHKEFAPDEFPEDVRPFAAADHGPNLSEVSAKFQGDEQGFTWLANWIHAPEAYHPTTLMPNLLLSWDDAADVASWLLSVPGAWPEPVEVRPLESDEVSRALDELVRLYKRRAGTTLSKLDEAVDVMSQDEKLLFLGERTIGRLGCFGCHDVPGFEDYKPIGTPLNGWGLKQTARLEYGHILDYLNHNARRTDDGEILYDGTPEYYYEELAEETREGFLFQKLHRPRSYDYKKTAAELKEWDERLRMPRFTWADDPEAIEEVMTFVLGLTGEDLNARYLPDTHYSHAQVALAEGRRLIDRYNCDGCHVLEMPKFVIPEGIRVADAATRFDQDVAGSAGPQGRGLDYLAEFYPRLAVDGEPDGPGGLAPDDARHRYVIEGMPISFFRDDESGDNELIVQLWRSVTIRGFTFNTGDRITLNPSVVERIPPVGGDFAWLFASTRQQGDVDEESGFAEILYDVEIWNNLPPPLIREGEKVQTPWLTRFLRDPYAIRPIAQLRMPRFHYLDPTGDTRSLADYFAAVDRAEFPYQDIPQRGPGYLAERRSQHPDYLRDGWHMIAGQGSACLQCHAVGSHVPAEGPDVVNGPHLNQVGDRFRPAYLAEWLANPARLLPYTKMPQNIPVEGTPAIAVPESFADAPKVDLIYAIRDTLMNYTTAVEQQLAAGPGAVPSPEEQPAEAEAGGDE